jgi:hypothetical protein
MSTENVNNREQTGGWLNVQFAILSEIKVCPTILTNENASLVLIEGVADTFNFLPIPESFTINVTPRSGKNGTTYSISISLDFPFQSSTIDSYLKKFINKKGVVIATDTNQTIKMFGSKTHPLDFSYQEINGKKLEDSSITRINIDGNIPQKPVYISV